MFTTQMGFTASGSRQELSVTLMPSEAVVPVLPGLDSGPSTELG